MVQIFDEFGLWATAGALTSLMRGCLRMFRCVVRVLQNAEQAKENGLPPPPAQPIPQGKEEEEMRNPKWLPLFTLPMIIKDQDQYPVRLCMNETSAFLAGSEEGDLFMCDWGGGKKEEGQEEGAKSSGVKQPIKSIQRDHVHTSMAVQRSPHFSDMLLTVGDWSFNIWKTGVEVRSWRVGVWRVFS